MQIATFVIAVFGAVVAAGNAVWSVAQWKLNGGRASVMLIVGAKAPGGLLVGEPGLDNEQNMARLAAQGYTDRVIGVTVTNTGRGPVRVQRWGIQCVDNGTSYIPLTDAIGPALPHVLDGGAQETWVVDLKAARALSDAATVMTQCDPEPVRGTVVLGDGTTLTTKKSLQVI